MAKWKLVGRKLVTRNPKVTIPEMVPVPYAGLEGEKKRQHFSTWLRRWGKDPGF